MVVVARGYSSGGWRSVGIELHVGKMVEFWRWMIIAVVEYT